MTTTQDHSAGEARREIEDLLPWYVAGTLSAADADRVEAALAADETLRPALEIAREEMGETVLMNQALGSPSPRALDALFAKIDAEPRRNRPVSLGLFDLGGRLAAWLQPRTLAWAGVAAAAIIAVQAGLLFSSSQLGSGPSAYHTASQGQAAGEAGTFLMLSFTPQATASEIGSTLQAANATIVDGPRAGGLYRIRIGAADLPRAEVERVLAELKNRPAVIRFVGLSQ